VDTLSERAQASIVDRGADPILGMDGGKVKGRLGKDGQGGEDRYGQ
jgi:hypothetical protein